MIASLVKHELYRRFSHWSSLILTAALIFQGIWYTQGSYEFYATEDLWINAAVISYRNLAGCGIIMVIIVAIVTGPVLYRELRHGTGGWLYSQCIAEKPFFVGRFLGALSINMLLGLAYLLGIILSRRAGIGPAEQFGPVMLPQLLHGYVTLLLPNFFILTSLTFAAVVFSRRLAVGYLVVLFLTFIFLIMVSTAETTGPTTALVILDPFGFVGVSGQIELLPALERNTAYLPLAGDLLLNRLLWCGLSGLMLFFAYRKWSFKYFLRPVGSTKKKKGARPQVPSKVEGARVDKAPVYAQRFGFAESLGRLLRLARTEFLSLVRPTGFRIILGAIIVMNLAQNLLWNASYYVGDTEPLTFTMTAFRLAFGVFIIIFLMVMAGELFFKDRSTDMWPVVDATPARTWTILLSRYLAMVGIALIMGLLLVFNGVLVQVIRGGADLIDPGLYAYDLLGYNWGWLTYVLEISLVFFVAGLTNNRMATHVICVGIMFGTVLAFELGLAEQVKFAYAAVPGLEDYSEMSHYGVWLTAARWYFLAWSLLAVAFLFGGVWLWRRGTARSLGRILSLSNPQLHTAGKVALGLALVGCAFAFNYIDNQVVGEGNYTPSIIDEGERADYENSYGYLRNRPQPRITSRDVALDLYPKERWATVKATLQLTELTDTLFLTWPDFFELEQVALNGTQSIDYTFDETNDLMRLPLSSTTVRDSLLELSFTARKQFRGFTQSTDEVQTALAANGSFASLRDYLPVIGFDSDKRLEENRFRRMYDLPRLSSRMAATNDAKARKRSHVAPDVINGSGRLRITTSAGQTPFGPGTLAHVSTTDGRRTHDYTIADQTPAEWFVGSARYDTLRRSANNVAITILHDPRHGFNAADYAGAAAQAIEFLSKNLGEYPYRELRIAEIPYHNEAFNHAPNLIAISEKEGWYARRGAAEEAAYIFQSVAARVIGQYFDYYYPAADVHGAATLRTALPEALALQLTRTHLGQEAFDQLTTKKQERYNRKRNEEPNAEPAPLYDDGAEYLASNRSALLLENILSQRTTKELGQSLATATGPYYTFADVWQQLRRTLTPELITSIEKQPE